MNKERRLGRGLEALLGRLGPSDSEASHGSQESDFEMGPPAASDVSELEREFASSPESVSRVLDPVEPVEVSVVEGGVPESRILQVNMHLIERNPYQPRRDFDEEELRTLAESLQAHGLLQPVIVRRMGEEYQLVAGERRLRAARLAGWEEVPVKVIDVDDRQAAELAIVENVQRKDLNAIEKALSFQRYLEQYQCPQDELASRLKINRSTVANLIRLLELPDAVKEAVQTGRISQGHARALLPLGDEREQIAFCERIQAEKMSVRQTESEVQQMIEAADAEPLGVVGKDGTRSAAKPPRRKSEHVAGLEQEFRAALGVRVKLAHNAQGKGKLTIHFADHDEFERLKSHICGSGAMREAG